MANKLYGTVLLKAKEILDYIASQTEGPTLNEISSHVDTSKPTVYKILQTLEYCGYVSVSGEAKRYRLGTVFLRYAQSVSDSINIMEIAKPYLKKLRDQTGETVNLGMVDNDHIVLLSKMESTNSIKLVSIIGGRMEMYSSAMGKSILAEYSARQLDEYLNKVTLHPLTDKTIVDKDRLKKDLVDTKARGYAVDDTENQPGVYCLGFALTANHKIYGAFSISTPEYRMDEKKRKLFVALGQETRQAIMHSI